MRLSALILITLFLPLPSMAQDKALNINDVYAFATAPTAKNGAVFMMINNKADQDDRLIDAGSDIAKHVELHENYIDDDRMRMRKLKDGIAVPANGSAELKPTGYHVMLIGLKEQLKENESFPLKLTFEKAGDIIITVPVTKPGQKPMTHNHDGHGH